jgi:putative hydrolase
MSGDFGFTPGGDFTSDPFAASANLPMIATQALRDSARNFLNTHSVIPVGTADLASVRDALDIANNWLDSATIFPTVSAPANVAWSRKDWLDSSIPGWQKLVEPLAEGMASALSELIGGMNFGETGETDEVSENIFPQDFPIPDSAIPSFNALFGANPMTTSGIMPMMRGFMGAMIATQLGQSVGALAIRVTGANDVALPLFKNCETHLIPQNITEWGEGLDLPKSEISIFLALRESAAVRLFTHAPWLSTYMQDAIAAYGRGIKIDIDAIQRQAEDAISSGALDIENTDSINLAITSGMFMPEQSTQQAAALEKLEMALALIEGWIDHVVDLAAQDRLPSLAALQEVVRRSRVTNSPTQQLFKSLLNLEVSPRKMRETAHFWSELNRLVGNDGRDHRWEDAALLPRSEDIADPAAFLKSTTVPDDLRDLI